MLILGAIHKQRRQFRGGWGVQIDDMGRYEGGRCQRISDIVNSRNSGSFMKTHNDIH